MSPHLRALGFCGADDSVHPNFLVMISHSYPIVEFGVLFRPDKEGQPRYATQAWVEQLSQSVSKLASTDNTKMKLAAHLCGSRVNDVLNGMADDFLNQLIEWGFQRVQINATAVNGVDTSKLSTSVPNVVKMVEAYSSKLEFIIQKNEETQPLWEGLIQHYKSSSSSSLSFPSNVSMLYDESKGTGVSAQSWPTPDDGEDYEIGYAGGIGPQNVQEKLKDALQAAKDKPSIWIDMESSLRSTKNGKDVFDLDKCYSVIESVCEMGLMPRPNYLC